MPIVRVYERPDGTVVIVSPAPGWTLEAACAVTVAKHGELAGLPTFDVDPAILPTRRFRKAWRRNGTAVTVDLPLARQQRLDEIRNDRDKRFAALDAEWMKAMGKGDAVRASAIETKRQQLRDVPQASIMALAALLTPDDVAAYAPTWPEM